MKKNEVKRNNKGFSLVELIVVIAIMAVLVGVLAPQFLKYVEKSRISTDIQNMDQMKTAIEVYCAENDDVSGKMFTNDVKTLDGQPKTVDNTKMGTALTEAELSNQVAFKSKKWEGVNLTVTTGGAVTVSGTAKYGGKTYHMDGSEPTTP